MWQQQVHSMVCLLTLSNSCFGALVIDQDGLLTSSPDSTIDVARDILLFDHNTSCTDIYGIHYPAFIKSSAVKINYKLRLLSYAISVTLSTIVTDTSETLSLTSVFQSTNWGERELYDMFGVYFRNHPDLRRILTDYGYKGHPLLKQHSVLGYEQKHYDYKTKYIGTTKLVHSTSSDTSISN
jgi:NADH-quinone oxidoreductase subunit C